MVHFYRRLATFSFGFLLGVILAKIYVYKGYQLLNVPLKKQIPSYQAWSTSQGFNKKALSWDILRYGNGDKYTLESNILFKQIQVSCIIFVRNRKNFDGAKHTWSQNCNNLQLIEIKSKKNKYIALKRTKENSSWVLLCQTLKNIADHYNWYLIVNDNTFTILENLRYFVAPYNSSDTHYFGYPVKFWNTIYNLGQAGYVLSKGALKAVQKNLTEADCSTNAYWNREDFYLGKLLRKLNIFPADTRDSEGLSRFHPYNWYITFFPAESNSYYSTSIYPVKCCSKQSITFQAIEGSKMYTYYYLLYQLQVFTGGRLGNRKYITESPDDVVWKNFLKERNIVNDNITSKEYYEVWRRLIEDPTSFASHMQKEIHFDYM